MKDRDFQFSREGDFKACPGVSLKNNEDGSLTMSQPHLCKSFVDSVGMMDSSPTFTPSSGPLFRHKDSKLFDGKEFNCRSAIGMLQCLGGDTRPDCSHAINSCARCSVEPREPHGTAAKRIARHIKGTLDKGMIIKPDMSNLCIDCCVDADFAGNWNLADAEDPGGVVSRTGFILTFAGVPVLWKSLKQDLIALSAMESECAALSAAMRSLIHLRALMAEICSKFNLACGDRVSTLSTVFEDNRAAKILATASPPRLTPRSKHIALRHHWFRSHLKVRDGSGIQIVDVQSKLNKADMFTKAQHKDAFEANRLAVCGWQCSFVLMRGRVSHVCCKRTSAHACFAFRLTSHSNKNVCD